MGLLDAEFHQRILKLEQGLRDMERGLRDAVEILSGRVAALEARRGGSEDDDAWLDEPERYSTDSDGALVDGAPVSVAVPSPSCDHTDVEWMSIETEYQADGTAEVWQQGTCRQCGKDVVQTYIPADIQEP